MMAKTPDEIRAKAAEIMREHKAQKSALYRKDGEPKYGEVEMRERIKELDDNRNSYLDSLIGEAKEEAASWQSYAASIREPDLAQALTDSELSRASHMYAFTSEEVASMSEEALANRTKAVEKKGDKASMLAHAKAIRKRANEEAARRASRATTNAGRVAGGIPSETLIGLVERLEEKIEGNSTSKASRLEHADKRRDEYEGAAFHVGGLRHPYRPNYAWPANARTAPRAG